MRVYHHPEVDRAWIYTYIRNVPWFVYKKNFYLLQDGCMILVGRDGEE